MGIMSVFITCFVFGFLTMYACCTKTDFTGFGAYLFGALLALTLFGFTVPLLASAGLSFTALNLVFNIVGVLLFVFYIIYDTQLIMGQHGGHKEQFEIDDYIFASLNLYLDVVNMFLYILQMFGDRNEVVCACRVVVVKPSSWLEVPAPQLRIIHSNRRSAFCRANSFLSIAWES